MLKAILNYLLIKQNYIKYYIKIFISKRHTFFQKVQLFFFPYENYIFLKKLQIYFNMNDLFHIKISRLIKFFQFYRLHKHLLAYMYRISPKGVFTQWLIKHTTIGYFEIIGINGGCIGIRKFTWFFNILIYEYSAYEGYEGVDPFLIQDHSIGVTSEMDSRRKKLYFTHIVIPAAVVFDIAILVPKSNKNRFDIKEWNPYCQTIFYSPNDENSNSNFVL
jgi:hypothetical protein